MGKTNQTDNISISTTIFGFLSLLFCKISKNCIEKSLRTLGCYYTPLNLTLSFFFACCMLDLFCFHAPHAYSQQQYLLNTFQGYSSGIRVVEFEESGNNFLGASKTEMRIWSLRGSLLNEKVISGYLVDAKYLLGLICFSWEFDKERGEYERDHYGAFSSWNTRSDKISTFFEKKIERLKKGLNQVDAVAGCYSNGLVAVAMTYKISFAKYNGSTRIFNLKSGREIGSFDSFPQTRSMKFSNNGTKLAASTKYKRIAVWSTYSWNTLWWKKVHEKAVTSVSFSNDGRYLVTGSDDKTLALWNATNGALIRKFSGHRDDVRAVAICPDGQFIASASKDKSIIIWDVKQGVMIKKLLGHKKGVNCVAFSPDGTKLVSGSDDKSCILWNFSKIIEEYREKQRMLAEIKAEKERRRLAEPSNLFITVKFDDSNSYFPNNILDASETASLKINLQNSGKGSGFDVSLHLVTNNPHLNLKSKTEIGEIAPGDSQLISIPINIGIDSPDGKASITIQAKEKRGYNARPVKIIIPVRHLDKPVLSISSFTLNDGTTGQANGNGNGIVENGETVEVTAFVKNTGVGVSLSTALNLKSVSAGARIINGSVQLGDIAPSKTKQGKVVVAIPRTFRAQQLQLTFEVHDKIGASKITKQHILPMSTRMPVIAFDERILDNSGVQVYDVSNGGRYILEIVPRNEGRITAKTVAIKVSAPPEIILPDSYAIVGDIAPGARAAEQRFNFSLPRNYNSDAVRFNLIFDQFDFPEPLSRTVEIPFIHRSPKLVVREILSTSNGDAEIQQGETVYFDLVVENQGDLAAEGVEALLDLTHSGIDFRERSKTIGRIPAGGKSNTIRFTFIVKTGAAAGPLSGQLIVSQADGFPDVKKQLDYSIKELGAEIVTVTPTVKPGATQLPLPVARTNTPPVVFLSPKNLGAEGKSFEPFVNLEIQIQDDKPMLSFEPEIRVNGKLQTKDQGLRGIGLQDREIQKIERKVRLVRRVELDEGFNHIEVRVYDSDNEMGMESTEIEYLAQRTDIWAIVIGVGDYENEQIDKLEYADNDAQSFYDFLRSPAGGNLQTDRIKLLLNREATRENILRDMGWITSRAFKNDLVIIYMALHGVVEQGELFFLAHNSDPNNLLATGIKKSDLENLLQRRMKSNKIVWFADACHSGSVGEDPQIALRANRASATNRLLREIAKARNGLALFMSAMGMEFSQESSKWGGGHGVFTYFLLKGLRGEADRNKDNFVSINELYDYLSRKVNEETNGKQNPVLYGKYDQGLKLSTIK